MKKLLFIAALAVFSLSGYAQEIRSGIKGGINLASVGGNDTEDYNTLIGIHFGALLEIPITKRFALQPELLYSSQGTKTKFNETMEESGYNFTVQATGKLHLHYLNVPVMAKLYVVKGFALEAGPQIGFLIAAKRKTEVDIIGNLPQPAIDAIKREFGQGSVDVKDYIQTVDFGASFGVSYQLDMGVFLGARYNLGLSNIHSESDDFKQQNNVIQIFAGYRF